MNSYLDTLRRAWHRARRVVRIFGWGATALPGIAIGEARGLRRLLIVYDLSSQPFSIGDILIFQEASLVLRAQRNLGKVDMAIVYDPKRPVVPDPAFREIDAESFLFHISSILPAAQVNPHLGSVLLLDSHRQLETYIADNADAYFVWPSLGQYASGHYLFYYCFNELFRDHFERYGCLPSLQSRPAALSWAARFIAQHTGKTLPVTVQLRNNKINPARNSKIDAWLTFFGRCAEECDATFFVICGRSEVDARLRELPNVIVVKDHGTTLEQDLALLEAGACHVGASSGPGTMLLFSDKPYCMFSWDLKLDSLNGLIKEDYRYRFHFSTAMQNWLFEVETAELLMFEFQRIRAFMRGSQSHQNPKTTSPLPPRLS